MKFKTGKPMKANRIAKAQKYASKLKAKTIRVKAKAEYRNAKREANLTKGGLRGKLARKREMVITKSESARKIEASKPELFKTRNKTAIETEAAIKKANAKYKGYAAVASALGASYVGGKKADSAIEESKTKAIEAGAKALETQIANVPEVKEDGGSVSGLVTGVR